jgi:ABC-type enterochelin transport system substrate-binding protein
MPMKPEKATEMRTVKARSTYETYKEYKNLLTTLFTADADYGTLMTPDYDAIFTLAAQLAVRED